MKALPMSKHRKNEKDEHEKTMEYLPFPIVYNKPPWVVYYYQDTYTCFLGSGEWNATCQTVEQVREYISDFKGDDV